MSNGPTVPTVPAGTPILPSGSPRTGRHILWRLLRAAAILAVGVAVLETLIILIVMINHRRGDVPATRTLVRVALAAGGMERVEFYAGDGLLLRGDLMGDAVLRPVVVFGHGYRDRRRSGDILATSLLKRGYAVLLFDFRGSGASDGIFTGVGAIEGQDVAAALRYLERSRHVPPRTTAYVGFSMGAAAALMAAPALHRLGAVVLIAPYARLEETFAARTRHFAGLPLRPWFTPGLYLFRRVLGVDSRTVNPVEHAAEIAPAALLVLGSRADWRATATELKGIYDRARPPRKLVLLAKGDHFALHALGPVVQEPVLRFLARHLPPGAQRRTHPLPGRSKPPAK